MKIRLGHNTRVDQIFLRRCVRQLVNQSDLSFLSNTLFWIELIRLVLIGLAALARLNDDMMENCHESLLYRLDLAERFGSSERNSREIRQFECSSRTIRWHRSNWFVQRWSLVGFIFGHRCVKDRKGQAKKRFETFVSVFLSLSLTRTWPIRWWKSANFWQVIHRVLMLLFHSNNGRNTIAT